MNKRNYQKELEKLIDQAQKDNKIPSLFLHSCCAPCSSYVLEYLSKYFNITVFYYNPNIYPEEEYRKRVHEITRLVNSMEFEHPVKLIEGHYDPQEFFQMAKGLEDLPEGGERCFKCYRLRMEEAAKLAGDLTALNQSRKALTEKGKEEAIRLIETTDLKNDRVLVVYLPDCHESLAGIIAGRIRERYNKPVIIWQNGNEGIDFAAYCRSIGVEAYVAMDLQDVNEIAHILWVRKAVRNTRALVLTAGSLPTFGIQSLIRDPEVLRQRYGFEVVKLPFTSIFKYMDEITDEEAKPIADKIIAGSTDTQVNTDWFINDIKYYLAAKKMMDIYDCNAFSTACHELCTTEIPQNRKFTPCMCHSIMKDEGIPSGCEEDLNALMAMLIMQYAANRPAFMGNPNHETDELLRIHHAVPALCMNG